MPEQRPDVRDAGRRLLRRSAQGVRRTVARRPRVFVYFAILGPGVITACAGNDAGGIATFASVGADYGYKLLWLLIPLTFSLGIVQEMCARMGAVTGKGLSDLVRERFGFLPPDARGADLKPRRTLGVEQPLEEVDLHLVDLGRRGPAAG